MIQEKVLELERRILKFDDQLTAMFDALRTLREEQTAARLTIKELLARVAALELQPKADLVSEIPVESDIVTTGRPAED